MTKCTIRGLALHLLVIAAAASLPLAHLAEAQQPPKSACPPPLRLGVVIPLSGPLAALGGAVKNGVNMAMEDLALSDPSHCPQIQVFYEDDGFTPARTLTAYRKLQSLEKIQALLLFGSATSNAVAPQSEEDKVILVSISSDPRVSRNRRGAFTLWVTPEAETEVANAEARQRGYRRIARITNIHDGAFAAKDAFDQLNGGQFEIVLDEDYALDQKDFKPFLAKLKTKGQVDAIFPLLFPEQLGIFARQARELGLTQAFYGYEMFEDENAIRLAQGALEKSWYASYAAPESNFRERYTTRFPGTAWLGAANGHDTVMLLAQALRNPEKGASAFDKMADFLRSLKDFHGALGTYSASGDNRFSLPAGLYEIRNGTFHPMTTANAAHPGSSPK